MMTRKLDAAIAEALGYEVIKPRFQDVRDSGGYLHKNVDMWTGGFSYYSTDGNAMLELDREMQARDFMLMVEVYNEGYSATYWICHAEEWTGDYVSDNMPKAVALAAYKALTGKEWRE